MTNELLDTGVGSMLLLSAAVMSIFLANYEPTRDAWLALWARPFGPPIGPHALTLRGWVNEALMSLFFFSVGLEIKKEITQGCLASPRQALLPCIAAMGGMVMPMLVYAVINVALPGGDLAGTAIPMATDIAFAMGVFQMFRTRMPAAASSFLLTLATVDDLGAIAVIVICFAGAIVPLYICTGVAVLAGAAAFGQWGLKSAAGFAIPGVALWYCLLRGGLNADIAGVLIALCVPMQSRSGDDVLERLIPRWSLFSSLVILPLFAFANCAMPIMTEGGLLAGSSLAVPAGVLLGLLVGKPLGIFSFSYLSIKVGLASMPAGMTTQHLAIVGILGAIGFTMCLFLVENSLRGSAAEAAKIAVFAGSVLGAAFGALALSLQPRRDETEVEW